jgi:hypothetical protein
MNEREPHEAQPDSAPVPQLASAALAKALGTDAEPRHDVAYGTGIGVIACEIPAI